MTYNTIRAELICKSFVILRLLNSDHFVCPFTVEGAAYPNVFRPISEPKPGWKKRTIWLMFTSYSVSLLICPCWPIVRTAFFLLFFFSRFYYNLKHGDSLLESRDKNPNTPLPFWLTNSKISFTYFSFFFFSPLLNLSSEKNIKVPRVIYFYCSGFRLKL